MTARLRLVLASLALILVVVSCGETTAGGAGRPSWLLSHHLGQPQGVTTFGLPGRGVRDAVLRSAASQIEVVSWGSSGCPRLPVGLVASAPAKLSVTMSDGAAPAGASCPADLTPTTSVIQIPGTVDLVQTINVTVIDGFYGESVALAAPPG